MVFFSFAAAMLPLGAVEYIIPYIENTPVIDGRISENEWQGAAGFAGLYHRDSEMFLSFRRSRWAVAYDRQNLYVMMQTEMPPDGKLTAKVRKKDGSVFSDDTIELWIADSEKAGERSYYSFLVNPLGTVSDTRFSASSGIADPRWNAAWKHASTRDKESGSWIFELAIPLKSLKFDGDTAGEKVSFMLCRNWQKPFNQTPFLQFPHPFTHYQKYPVFTFGKRGGKAVMVESVSGLADRDFILRGTVYNSGSENSPVKAKIKWTHSDMPDHESELVLDAAPGRVSAFEFKTSTDYIHNRAKHTAHLILTDGSGNVIYEDKYAWKLPGNLIDEWKIDKIDTSAQISYYPSTSTLGFRIDIYDNNSDNIKVAVSKKGGTEIVIKDFPARKGENMHYFQLPKLAGGEYVVDFTLSGKGKINQKLKCEFIRNVFPWEGSQLGITDKVYAPFTDLKYGSDFVKTVTSLITFNRFGLFKQVNADGKDLLAGDCEFFCEVDGKPVALKAVSFAFSSKKAASGTFEANIAGPGFSLDNKVETEYDGCSKFTLSITPEPGRKVVLDKFYLDIPLKSELIKLFHVISAGAIRSNPAIKVPDGEGVIWRSTDVANGDMFGNMHCYLWLGEMARGLCYFNDSEREMSLNENIASQELLRKDGKLILRIYFVNKKTPLERARTIIFGMQASPTKPMPADFRKPEYFIPPHGGSAYYAGGFTGMSKYPTNNDWEVTDQMVIARKTGKLPEGYIRQWLKKYWEGHPRYQSIKAHIYAGFISFMIQRPQSPTMFYFEEYGIDQFIPEFITYQDEWGAVDFTQRKWLKKEDITSDAAAANSIKIIPVKSYQDYALHYAAKYFERGIGLYFDNVYPKSNFDRRSSQAYTRSDGQIQPCSEIWNMREYHKRMWVLSREMQSKTPWPLQISLHTTNCMCIPILSWTDTMLDLEWGWANGTKPFPPELLEIESTARQIGAYPHAHFPLIGNANTHPTDPTYMRTEVTPEIQQTEWAMRVIYEILRQNFRGMNFDALDKKLYDFGYPEKCRIFNYWDDDYPVKVDNENIKSITLDNGKQIMMIFASWSEKPVSVKVSVSESLGCSENGFTLDFTRYGSRIIIINKK